MSIVLKMCRTVFAVHFLVGFASPTPVQFDRAYLRLQGYQITAVLEEKAKTTCWKEAYDELKKDCRGKDDTSVVWVKFMIFSKKNLFHFLF